MNNEDFFDIIGNIDDDIISDAAFTVKKKRGIIRRIITVSAAVFIFLLGGILVKNGFFNTDYILPTEKTTENETLPSDDITEDVLTEYYPETTSPTETETRTEEQTSEIITPSSGEVTEEITTEKENAVVFNKTDIINLLSGSTASPPDGYPIAEKTDIFTLEKIYGTSVIPSYLPVISSGNSLQDIEKKYTVYYNDDKSEVFCNNTFRYFLKDGSVLSIKASTGEIPKPEADSPSEAVSYINSIPIVLYKAEDGIISNMLCAYFVKDGCFFIIGMSGIEPDEAEFIKIISSLMK